MRRLTKLAAIAGTTLALTMPTLVSAADHLDGPAVSANGAIDIADLYVFEGSDPANTVLSFTVNPAAGNISGTSFDAGAEYAILIDTDGDAVEDIEYLVDFEDVVDGSQAYTVSKDGAPIAAGVTNSNVSIETGGMAFAGLVDDPFFFDLEGFSQLKQTLLDGGTLEDAISLICDTDPDVNFFAGFDASAIVLEVPDTELGGEIEVWAETRSGGQIDRKGFPGINTVFITGDDAKNGYNAAEPANDTAEYTDEVVGITAAIQQALGASEADAMMYGETVAGILLPDTLPYNTANPADFSAFNGRGLADDVIDVYYQVLTTVGEADPALTGDCVANDSTFRGDFPYYGAANAAGGGEEPTPAPSGSPAQMPDTGIEAPAGTSPIGIAVLALAALTAAGTFVLVRARR